MPPTRTRSRRTFLALSALAPLAGCSPGPAAPAAQAAPPDTAAPPDPAAPKDPGAPVDPAAEARFAQLEARFGARLGLYAEHTGTGASLAHRADERFALCSTFKVLAAAAVLDRHPLPDLETVVRFGPGDLMKSSVITRGHLDSGMTLAQVCDAAVRYSDGTAGNLLLRELGGPAGLTAYTRRLGDQVTRLDRFEPALADAVPGDPRDTTTPRAFARNLRRLVLGDALPPDRRGFLRDLLERNATRAGAERIRAGLPVGWRIADKTGTGDYGALNDIAVVWPPDGAPLVVAVMTGKATRDAPYDPSLLAQAAGYVAGVLR